MENTNISFEQTLNATVRMLRTAWKTPVCLFLQTDDLGGLQLRAADGLHLKAEASTKILKPIGRTSAECLEKNQVIETDGQTPSSPAIRLTIRI